MALVLGDEIGTKSELATTVLNDGSRAYVKKIPMSG